MLTRRRVLAAALAAPLPGTVMRVHAADAFVDSVGVCTHLSSEPYLSAFGAVRAGIAALGIRHLRDELRPDNDLDRWRTLFRQHGVRSHLLVSPATNTVPEMLRYIGAVGPETVSAIEGQNEGDSDWFMAQPQARPRWDRAVVAYQRDVFRALRARYPMLPILSPSVIDYKPADAKLLRPAAPFSDIVAMHPYAQRAQEPETAEEYAGLDWYLRTMRDGFKPGAPVMATEAGYATLDQPGGISETAQAVYLPRLLLHFFAAGIRRTFLYELMDGGADPAESEHHYGLLRHDGTPKPAFTALQTLLQSLADPGPVIRPGMIGLEMSGASRMVVFQARDGTITAAIWRPERLWDPQRRVDLPINSRSESIRASIPMRDAMWRTLDAKGWTPLPSAPTLTVPVGAAVTLVRFRPA